MKEGNRWYDEYPDLADALEKLKSLDKTEREEIFQGLRELIIEHDSELFNRHVMDFPMDIKRRWYDKEATSWLVVNGLKYVDREFLDDIVLYMKRFV